MSKIRSLVLQGEGTANAQQLQPWQAWVLHCDYRGGSTLGWWWAGSFWGCSSETVADCYGTSGFEMLIPKPSAHPISYCCSLGVLCSLGHSKIHYWDSRVSDCWLTMPTTDFGSLWWVRIALGAGLTLAPGVQVLLPWLPSWLAEWILASFLCTFGYLPSRKDGL